MKSLTRRLMVGALIVFMGLVSVGVSTKTANAGLPSLPKIPGVSGLTPQLLQAILQNQSAREQLIGVLTTNLHDGYVPKSASFNSLTGEVTIYSKRPGGGTRISVISLVGDQGGTATAKTKKK